jgi:putative ABC transport system permease protein
VAGVVARIQGILGAATLVVALLTAVALLVAALGIVNTLVTSVLERTREIGLWKALGATSHQVRGVFLLEAALLGLLGGLTGVGLALLAILPADAAASHLLAERAAFPLRTGVFFVPPWLPIAGPALSTVVAMLAALQPAHRAARVDPVRALRHE